MLQRECLAPGVHLNCIPADKFNRCRISLHFRFPASREKATDQALLPLVMDRGYAACPDMTQLSRKLARLYGAALSVETSMQGASRVLSVSITGIKDRFALNGEALTAEYAAIAFGVAFEPYFENGCFSREAVEIEKTTLARQLESEINDKRLYCVRQARRKFFGDSPAGIERDGYLADLPAVTCESLTAVYQEMLRTAQLDVICLGADEAVVRRMILEKLAVIQREPAQLENYLYMPAQPTEHFREEMDLVQAKLCMMFTWNQCAKPEQLNAFRLAMSVFGGSTTSRLFLNVREKQSLCYYCASRFASPTAFMMVDSGVEPANAEKAEQAILKELENLVNGPITEEELENSRRGLLSGMTSVGDSLAGLENWYYNEILRGGVINTPEQAASQLMQVSAEDVRQILAGFRYSVGYLVTKKEEPSHAE